jgi:hypothetical protein
LEYKFHHTKKDFHRELVGGKQKISGSLKCYPEDQADIIIKCDTYVSKFLSIFPPPGVSGWFALGVDFERMKKIAAEIEEREAKRVG